MRSRLQTEKFSSNATVTSLLLTQSSFTFPPPPRVSINNLIWIDFLFIFFQRAINMEIKFV